LRLPSFNQKIAVTTSCICGSDLHMYEGRTAAQAGIVFGHEK
jgi:threonine dehydrogenase-like Zn-dependent dehydrogenase